MAQAVSRRYLHVGFVVDKMALGTSVFPCQFHSTCALLIGKMKNVIIIRGLHNKPQGTSVSSVAGPFNKRFNSAT
jgi:hypothetical protein